MLTDAKCRNAVCPPDKKRARFTDSGGLYLEVSPAGSKRCFCKLYADGKEGRMALGGYPSMGLFDARKASMKMKRTKQEKEQGDVHTVSLPIQAVALLRSLHSLMGYGRLRVSR